MKKILFNNYKDYKLNFKRKYMTYIVGGKLNNNPFLMIDCKIAQNDFYIFNDKVVQFYSCNEKTYLCQMGYSQIKMNIMIYDTILDFKNEKIDVFNQIDVSKMFAYINRYISENNIDTTDYTESQLFFMSKTDICRYSVNFNKDKLYHNISKSNINNNTYITSNSPLLRTINNIQDNTSLKQYCKNVIEEEKMGITDDLKDRYTFLYTENDILNYELPFKSENDIINQFFGLGFDKLQ